MRTELDSHQDIFQYSIADTNELGLKHRVSDGTQYTTVCDFRIYFEDKKFVRVEYKFYTPSKYLARTEWDCMGLIYNRIKLLEQTFENKEKVIEPLLPSPDNRLLKSHTEGSIVCIVCSHIHDNSADAFTCCSSSKASCSGCNKVFNKKYLQFNINLDRWFCKEHRLQKELDK